jgi:PAS domain S-box-containing protein
MGQIPIRILHIEDDSGLARLFQRTLRRHGYEVDVAGDGKAGLEMFESGSYDLLAIDHRMPGMTGLELIRVLASRAELPNTIMITGEGSEVLAVEAMKLGASDYIIKDADGRYLDLMPAVVAQAIERKRLKEAKAQAEAALRESEARFKEMAESIQEVFWLRTQDRFIYVSPAYEHIWGQSCAGLLEDPESALAPVHPEDLEKARSVVDGRGQGEEPAAEVEFRLQLADGETRWVRCRSFPVKDPEGVACRYAGVAEDFTERRKAQEAALRTERLKAVGELATGVAHNFNNLFQIIVGSAQLIELNTDPEGSAVVRRYAEQILESARLGAETVKRLQKVAGLRTDRVSAEGRTFDLSDTANQAIEMTEVWWKAGADRDGISIDMISDLRPGCKVVGNKDDLFEVILNLIRNAVEALPSGGEIRISTAVDNDDVCLRVADTGVGVPEAAAGKIFQPFFTTKGLNRAGMGLAGSHGIVLAHNGDIAYESQEGKGSAFTVRLPLAEDRRKSKRPEAQREDLKLRILVVDDLQPIVSMLEAGLTKFGQTVLTAMSGPEGVEIFKRNPIDLVVCDFGMPVMNGWQVAETIKRICGERRTPKPAIILLTGWGGQTKGQDKAAESGVDRILEKPVDISELLRTAQEILG